MSDVNPQPLLALLRPVPLLHPEMTIAEAATLIAEAGCGLPVVDSGGRLVGYLGERALLKAIVPGYLRELHDTEFFTRDLTALGRYVAKAAAATVGEHLTEVTAVLHASDSETHAAELFLHSSVRVLAVVGDQSEVMGIVRLGDLVADLMRRSAASATAE